MRSALVISPHRDDAALAALVGDRHNHRGQPREAVRGDAHPAKGIVGKRLT